MSKKGIKEQKADRGYRGQAVFTTESDSDSTPFNARFGGAKDFSEKNRLAQDKRLNNYLMQAQKMMQKRASHLEENDRSDPLRTIVVEDTELYAHFEHTEAKTGNGAVVSPHAKQSSNFDKNRKSYAGQSPKNATESDLLEPIEEVKSANSRGLSKRKNTDQTSGSQRGATDEGSVARVKTVPLTTKHDAKPADLNGFTGAK